LESSEDECDSLDNIDVEDLEVIANELETLKKEKKYERISNKKSKKVVLSLEEDKENVKISYDDLTERKDSDGLKEMLTPLLRKALTNNIIMTPGQTRL
jgi:ABC-type phosphate transport system auxiliary subunit